MTNINIFSIDQDIDDTDKYIDDEEDDEENNSP